MHSIITGQQFAELVRKTMAEADRLNAADYAELTSDVWYVCPEAGWYVCPDQCGNNFYAVGGVSPREAWNLRNGHGGAKLWFALDRDRRLLVLVPRYTDATGPIWGCDGIGFDEATRLVCEHASKN